MSLDYWLGVATLPAVTLVGAAVILGWFALIDWLDARWGISFEAKVRSIDGVGDYILRNNIWWERSWGPVFAGGWYREHSRPMITRWIGFGSADGPCLMIFKKRVLP